MIAKIYKPKIYIELGVHEGENFNRVIKHCGRGYAVDVKEMNWIEGKKSTGFVGTTDDFFDTYGGGADMIFIDACHTYKQVCQDFFNSMRVLNEGGIILLHDIDPESDKLLNPQNCGDAYKILDELEELNYFNMVTLPLGKGGISIVTRKNDTRTTRRHK